MKLLKLTNSMKGRRKNASFIVARRRNRSAQRSAKLSLRLRSGMCLTRYMAATTERILSGSLAQPVWGKLEGYGTCSP